MGKVLIIALLIFSSTASANLQSLARDSNIDKETIINYVQNNMPLYSKDPVIVNCLEKLNVNKDDALSAMFNYILFKNYESKASNHAKSSNLQSIRKMMKIGREAKKSIIYCNN